MFRSSIFWINNHIKGYHVKNMVEEDLATGVVHDIPNDLRQVLLSSPSVQDAWNDLTPLARNEWICWAISVKKEETRKNHIQRVKEDLLKGKR